MASGGIVSPMLLMMNKAEFYEYYALYFFNNEIKTMNKNLAYIICSSLLMAGGAVAQNDVQTSTSQSSKEQPQNGQNSAPSVEFAQADNAYNFILEQDMDIEVMTTHMDGQITKVELQLNGEFVRNEYLYPYTWSTQVDEELAALAPGVHTLTAIVTDDSGDTSTVSMPLVLNDANCVQ